MCDYKKKCLPPGVSLIAMMFTLHRHIVKGRSAKQDTPHRHVAGKWINKTQNNKLRSLLQKGGEWIAAKTD